MDVFKELLLDFGMEASILAVIAIFGAGAEILRRKSKTSEYGTYLTYTASLLDDIAPIIVDSIQRSKKVAPVAGVYAKAKAIEAAKSVAPLAANLAKKHLDQIANDAIEKAYKDMNTETSKRIQSLGISATTDGKQIASEIKAGFKRGSIALTGEAGRKGYKAGIRGAFRF